MAESGFRVLLIQLDSGQAELIAFGDRAQWLGGSGLAVALYQAYGLPDAPFDHPEQPLIFAIGTLTGYFPLMSKVVCGFKSPYHNQYAESHAGGRLALALRFAGCDAVVIRGRSAQPTALGIGTGGAVRLVDVHYLWGEDVFATGKLLRRIFPEDAGHRSMLRIGPAGEKQLGYACINVDTYRHFGRLGTGTVMGSKRLKAIVVGGEAGLQLPGGQAYSRQYAEIHRQVTATPLLQKYHDLGTAENLAPLNAAKALPWRNLQQTSDPAVDGVSGETFSAQMLLRQTACAGCPVGCIHIGMLREQFAHDSHFQYREVGYDYEPIFAAGTMLGLTRAGEVLTLLDEVEKLGMDIMSAGVALAWAAEAFCKGVISERETLVPLAFGQLAGFKAAVVHLGTAANEFYRLLGQGTLQAAAQYGGEDFACVLGQEMAGYATGEVFFTAQSLGFRHSHLDAAGYSYDQTQPGKDVEQAVAFLVEDERSRCLLTSCVGCLFARKVYSEPVLAECLDSLGWSEAAQRLPAIGGEVQRARWRMRLATGYDPRQVPLPRRFTEVKNWKGEIDLAYLQALRAGYAGVIEGLGRAD